MPKGEYDTPGPFTRTADTVHREGRAVMILGAPLCGAERDELVGLLNKGTHFEPMLAALRRCLAEVDDRPELEIGHLAELIAQIRAAVTAAAGRTARNQELINQWRTDLLAGLQGLSGQKFRPGDLVRLASPGDKDHGGAMMVQAVFPEDAEQLARATCAWLMPSGAYQDETYAMAALEHVTFLDRIRA